MNIFCDNSKLANFKSLSSSASRIAIVSHTNPDGDAIGAGVALLRFMRKLGYSVRFFVPNHYPQFLQWVDPQKTDIEIFGTACQEAGAYIAAADLIVCVDFNQLSRLELMTPALESNIHAERILIDHHLGADPSQFAICYSDTTYSSTAHMIYDLIVSWGGVGALDREIGDALYLGIMTDTGCFSYGNLRPELYRAVADVVELGVDVVAINRAVFDNQSQDRLRLVGYLLSQKMVVHAAKHAAYITLTAEEKQKFNHQIGDTEGIVNLPLTMRGIDFSAIFIETQQGIKISLRSQGDLDVNIIARQHFNGGGHKNAAGGKLPGVTMEQAVAVMEELISSL